MQTLPPINPLNYNAKNQEPSPQPAQKKISPHFETHKIHIPKSDNTLFLTPKEIKKVISPDKDCKICQGVGTEVSRDSSGKIRRTTCSCVFQQEVIQYLTPIYATCAFIPTLKASEYEKKNLVFQDISKDTFNSLVMSFLLNSLMKYKHLTLCAHQILIQYFQSTTTGEYSALSQIQHLILHLDGIAYGDPPNKLYGSILINVLKQRAMQGYATWIHTPNGVKHSSFVDCFGGPLSEYLQKNFETVGASS